MIHAAIHAALLLSLSTLGPLPQEPVQKENTIPNGVEITYLANEGFQLRMGPFSILIDAFVAEPYSGYEAVRPDTMQKLASAKPPFDSTPTMVLTSHIHRDHFQPKYVETFLRRNTGANFVSSPQAVNTLRKHAENFKAIQSRCPKMAVAPGESQVIPGPQVSVEFMNLPHGGDQHTKITNYGHLIQMGDLKILHIGDADMKAENFAPYELGEREIDIAFVPYWYFGEEQGLKIVDEHIKANYLIACHFPVNEKRELVAQLLESNPHVLVFAGSGDKKIFQSDKE